MDTMLGCQFITNW